MQNSDLSRREFMSLGLGLLVASSQACAFVPKRKARPRILVIGAGMAGLAAARELHDSGLFEVVVLEARERIGGRMESVRNARGELIERGAAWIHGEKGNPLADLCRRYGLSTRVADNWSSVISYDENGRVSRERREGYEDIYQGILDQMRKRKQNFVEKDISLRQAVDEHLGRIKNPEQRKFLEHLFKTNIEDDYGTDLENISFRNWNEEIPYELPDLIVNDGYSALAAKLAAGLEIKTRAVVRAIDYGEAKVRVYLQDERVFEADQVVVTLPLGVLKAGHVQFSPALPAWKRAAIDQIGMAEFSKIFLSYGSGFWPQETSWIECVRDPRPHVGSFFNLKKFGGGETLVGLASGKSGAELQKLSPADAEKWASRSLRNLQISLPPPVAVDVTRWAVDPYALGSYSYPSVGETPEHREWLSASVGESLHFAGEACQSDFYGSVHGAYLSGQRRAQKILKKQSVI